MTFNEQLRMIGQEKTYMIQRIGQVDWVSLSASLVVYEHIACAHESIMSNYMYTTMRTATRNLKCNDQMVYRVRC